MRDAVAKRRISFHKCGALLRFDPDDLDEFMRRSRVPATGQVDFAETVNEVVDGAPPLPAGVALRLRAAGFPTGEEAKFRGRPVPGAVDAAPSLGVEQMLIPQAAAGNQPRAEDSKSEGRSA